MIKHGVGGNGVEMASKTFSRPSAPSVHPSVTILFPWCHEMGGGYSMKTSSADPLIISKPNNCVIPCGLNHPPLSASLAGQGWGLQSCSTILHRTIDRDSANLPPPPPPLASISEPRSPSPSHGVLRASFPDASVCSWPKFSALLAASECMLVQT